MQIAEVPVGHGQCFVRSCGSGPPLMLLHAGVADSRMWQPQFESFCPQYELIAPDLRGYGRSLLPAVPFSYMDDLRDILAHFGSSKICLVGNSFGSYLAANFALANPAVVEQLILLAPTLGGFEADAAVQEFQREENRLLEEGRIDAATALNLRFWIDGPKRNPSQVDGEVRELVREMQKDAFVQPEPAGVKLLDEGIDEMDRYAALACPVLMLIGDQDQPSVLKHAAALDQMLPNARLERIEGAGHLLSLEMPHTVNSVIKSVL